ncbi:hypothetical protein [Gordonia polyisoprenivorans]|uniref:hypothetical protein n=1 Tax=Gordonia polyisoprenivorans TaxID=84595 RepID=UPI002301B3DC|nr:hypothetical protein [Gordonia polyisoprenivorans]WCB37789.1 hypothetical protein PHA63_01070 [Gordonia polyisoprenivorans]
MAIPESGKFDVDSATRVLAAVLTSPAGARTAIGAFADVPGLVYQAEQPARLLRAAKPPVLRAGEWEFVATGPGAAPMELRHTVRGITLQTERPAPSDAARRLAVEVLSAAQQLGSETDIAVHSALYGLAAIV